MTWQTQDPILVPFDFSEHSRAALKRALEIAEDPSQVHLVHVLSDFTPTEPGVGWGLIDDSQRLSQTMLALQEEVAKSDASKDVEPHVLLGDPGSSVCDLVNVLGAKLVVIGSHGRTGLARIVLGSVAERVSRLAPCPVLVVKLDAEASAHSRQGTMSEEAGEPKDVILF